MDVESGTLEIFGGGTNNGGTFNVALNSVCYFNSSYTFNDGSTFSGAGVSYLNYGNPGIVFNGRFNSANLQWLSGFIGGQATNIAGSTFYIVSGNTHYLPGCTFDNRGTINWSAGNLGGGSNAMIYNENLWLDGASGYQYYLQFTGGSRYYNTGTYQKTNSGTTYFQPGFLLINGNLMDVQNGTLYINDGGGTNNAGTFNAAGGAVCNFVNAYTFNDGSTFSGAGASYLNNGNPGIVFNGGFNSANLQWVSGYIGGQATNIAGSTLYIVSGNNHYLPGCTFDNKGTVNWSGGNLGGGNNTMVYNENLWLDGQSGYQIYNQFGGAAQFYNTGTYQKTNSGTTYFQPGFLLINSSLVDVENGLLYMNDGGGTNNGTGIFNAAAGALCEFANAYTFNNGSTFTGAGASYLQFGNPGIVFNGGFNSANLQWISGYIGGHPTNNAGSTFYIESGNGHYLPNTYLKNLGTILHAAGHVQGGSSTIDNSGLWQEQAGGYEFDDAFAGSGATFLNSGTFSQATGSGTVTFQANTPFTNTGVLEVLSGHATFNGVFDQDNGTMRFGLASPSTYGTVSVASALPLNGTLGSTLLALIRRRSGTRSPLSPPARTPASSPT